MTNNRILPGFRLSLGFTLLYMLAMVAVPLLGGLAAVTRLPWNEFVAAVWTERARAAYWITFWCAFRAGLVSMLFGGILAWVLVRYRFPGRKLFDSLVDLPFALPTAVAGLVFSSLYAKTGWLGQYLVPMGIEIAYTEWGMVLVMAFIGFPFVVRAVQPVLENLDGESEEAARLLGASRWQTFRRVTFPAILPSLVAGFSMAFARALGEYGSVVFISSNRPGKTEIAAVLIVQKLEEFKHLEATAVSVVLLAASFVMLGVINLVGRWSRRSDN